MGWERFLKMIECFIEKDEVKIRYRGQRYTIPGKNINGTNYVNIRELLGVLGYEVDWDGNTKEVIIK